MTTPETPGTSTTPDSEVSSPAPPRSRFGAWCQLLRLPNLFTVPGDPLAGFLLAWAAGADLVAVEAIPVVLASLLLYSFGLVHNDIRDLGEDRRDRPNRPIPSGRIPRRTAGAVAVLLAGAGLGGAFLAGTTAFVVAAVLALAIIAYNALTKRIPVLGPLNMGLCRGLSVLLGASAAGIDGVRCLPVLMAAGLIVAYIAAVTAIAARETTGKPVGERRNLPVCILVFALAWLVTPVLTSPPAQWFAWAPAVPALAAVVQAGYCALLLGGTPEPAVVQKTVGRLVRGLLLIQATLACLAPMPGLYVAAALLLAWPASSLLARRFYAS